MARCKPEPSGQFLRRTLRVSGIWRLAYKGTRRTQGQGSWQGEIFSFESHCRLAISWLMDGLRCFVGEDRQGNAG
jgi:hypothetical protein